MAHDESGVQAWASLLRTHAAVLPRLAEALLRVGLPITWYDVLLVLNSAPGGRLRMSELGNLAVVSRERVSRVVTEMERDGLVSRAPSETDGRAVVASITTEGRARLRAAAPTYLAAIETHFAAHLSDTEKRIISKALGRVLAAESPSATLA